MKRLVEEIGRMWRSGPADICAPLAFLCAGLTAAISPQPTIAPLLTVNRLEP